MQSENKTSLIGAFRTILWIGLVAGTLDITENLVFNWFRGITPWRVFQYIASGAIGMQAFKIGWVSVGLGVIIHYAIAVSWTAVFFVVASRIVTAVRHPIVSGLIYGLIVYLIMNFVVVPHIGVPHPPATITFASRINAVLALLFCIGLPVSLLVRRTLSKTRF